ncbi:hypothetical protein GQ42DRAFT_7034 [Ramicandelaber brevisporus]|nr:hypothetical protein GQ42DRAFT_7034 [Ramicandelaber brevisporus]
MESPPPSYHEAVATMRTSISHQKRPAVNKATETAPSTVVASSQEHATAAVDTFTTTTAATTTATTTVATATTTKQHDTSAFKMEGSKEGSFAQRRGKHLIDKMLEIETLVSSVQTTLDTQTEAYSQVSSRLGEINSTLQRIGSNGNTPRSMSPPALLSPQHHPTHHSQHPHHSHNHNHNHNHSNHPHPHPIHAPSLPLPNIAAILWEKSDPATTATTSTATAATRSTITPASSSASHSMVSSPSSIAMVRSETVSGMAGSVLDSVNSQSMDRIQSAHVQQHNTAEGDDQFGRIDKMLQSLIVEGSTALKSPVSTIQKPIDDLPADIDSDDASAYVGGESLLLQARSGATSPLGVRHVNSTPRLDSSQSQQLLHQQHQHQQQKQPQPARSSLHLRQPSARFPTPLNEILAIGNYTPPLLSHDDNNDNTDVMDPSSVIESVVDTINIQSRSRANSNRNSLLMLSNQQLQFPEPAMLAIPIVEPTISNHNQPHPVRKSSLRQQPQASNGHSMQRTSSTGSRKEHHSHSTKSAVPSDQPMARSSSKRHQSRHHQDDQKQHHSHHHHSHSRHKATESDSQSQSMHRIRSSRRSVRPDDGKTESDGRPHSSSRSHKSSGHHHHSRRHGRHLRHGSDLQHEQKTSEVPPAEAAENASETKIEPSVSNDSCQTKSQSAAIPPSSAATAATAAKALTKPPKWTESHNTLVLFYAITVVFVTLIADIFLSHVAGVRILGYLDKIAGVDNDGDKAEQGTEQKPKSYRERLRERANQHSS